MLPRLRPISTNSDSSVEWDGESPTEVNTSQSAGRQTAYFPRFDGTFEERRTVGTVNHVYPDYAEEDKRHDTFVYSDWPNEHGDIDETKWIGAGFYYSGTGTCVNCYSCGLGLSGITATDDPWEQHALQAPTCAHLVEHKGQSFVQEVLNRMGQNQDGPTTNDDIQYRHRAEGDLFSPPEDIDFSDYDDYSDYDGHSDYGGYSNGSILVPRWLKLSSQNHGHSDAFYLPAEKTHTSETEEELEEENKRLKEQMLCKVCRTEKPTYLLQPCGHLACCEGCAESVNECPMCHTHVKTKLKIYMA